MAHVAKRNKTMLQKTTQNVAKHNAGCKTQQNTLQNAQFWGRDVAKRNMPSHRLDTAAMVNGQAPHLPDAPDRLKEVRLGPKALCEGPGPVAALSAIARQLEALADFFDQPGRLQARKPVNHGPLPRHPSLDQDPVHG